MISVNILKVLILVAPFHVGLCSNIFPEILQNVLNAGIFQKIKKDLFLMNNSDLEILTVSGNRNDRFGRHIFLTEFANR